MPRCKGTAARPADFAPARIPAPLGSIATPARCLRIAPALRCGKSPSCLVKAGTPAGTDTHRHATRNGSARSDAVFPVLRSSKGRSYLPSARAVAATADLFFVLFGEGLRKQSRQFGMFHHHRRVPLDRIEILLLKSIAGFRRREHLARQVESRLRIARSNRSFAGQRAV